jgi:hypothetical protein
VCVSISLSVKEREERRNVTERKAYERKVRGYKKDKKCVREKEKRREKERE